MKKTLLLLLAFVLILSCSKDDSADPIDQNGGEIFRSQVVTVTLSSVTLSANEYQGTLDGAAIVLTKSEDNKLLFLVPNATTIGLQDLLIPSLNNMTIHYDVKDTVLSETPEVTLSPLFVNLDIFALTLATSSSPEALNMQNNLDSFTNYYNNASIEDKTQIAIAYKANKTIIDEIILNDYSNVSGKLTQSDKNILLKFSIAVVSIDIGSHLAINGFHPGVRALGVIIAGVATTSAIDFYVQFIEKEVKELGLNINSISGINDKNTLNTVLTIQDNVASTFPISTLKRKLNSGDSNLSQPLAIAFFKSKVAYNYVINKVNTAIQFLNDNNSFFTFGLLQLAQLPSDTTPVLRSTNQEIYDKITFSVNHPNLSIVSTSLQSDGQMTMKIKIVGTPASLPIDSFLNYNYSDEFSTFSGKLAIQVANTATVAIGDNYQGGVVAYILQNGDPGYDANVQHGLIATPNDQSTDIMWWSTYTTTGASGIVLGTGATNTNTIIGSLGTGSYAARICHDLVFGGYSDWYLPSKDELNKLYINRTAIGGFIGGGTFNFYWSSSESSSSLVWGQYFSDGSQLISSKEGLYHARAVRSF